MTNLPFAGSRAVAAAFAAFLALPSAALALTSAESSCRDAIAKSMASYAKTTGKLVADCHKQRSAGGSVPLSTDCNDVDSADTAGRLATERSRGRAAISGACAGADSLLPHYSSCPAPASFADDDGATTGIDDFGEVADCLHALSDAAIGGMSGDALGNPDEHLADSVAKCQGVLGKLTSTMVKAYMKEGRKCQRRLDTTSNDPDFGCDPASSIKVAKARDKFNAKFSACVLPSDRLETLNACGEDFVALRECSRGSADNTGEELIRNVYEFEEGSTTTTEGPTTTTTTTTSTTTTTTITTTTTTTTLPPIACGTTAPVCNGACPSGQVCESAGDGCACAVEGSGACAPATIRRIIHGKNTVPPTQTSLSTGWSGSAHDIDIPNDIVDAVDVTCDANCENCEVSLNVQEGNPASNCRCASDSTQTCGVINGPDTDNCGGVDPTCRCYFGSPLGISAGGTPVCVVNRITEDFSGTMNLRTGEWDVRIKLAAVVHLGSDTVHPCPQCEGDVTFNDGVRDGTCTGSVISSPCDVNGEHLTFGPTSFDCLPNSATNISGGGLLIDLKTSSASQSLGANLPCDTPVGAMCPCRVCSGNSNVGCSSDADCTEVGAGVCTAGGGAGVQPNQCDGFTCGADGHCTTGPVDSYCDGVTHPDGRGFISCNTDVDCQATSQGACTVIDVRRCYTDPIVVNGRADTYNPVTGAIFCIPPTTSPAVNLTGGIPGPGVFVLDFDSDVRCQSDPNLVYEFPNGANCETAPTTTSTTLFPPLECESAVAPACGGSCPTGQTCGDNGGVCECSDPPIPLCEDALSPVCGGTCPVLGQVCLDAGGTCFCSGL